MKLTLDTKQRITSGFTFLLEFYKVLMGSFITIFVPHQCGDHLCSMKDDLSGDDAFRTFCVTFNFLSCLMLMELYFIELRRENWCITYLDIDPKQPNNNLDMEIEDYPKIKEEMKSINQKYKKRALICVGAQSLNILTSTIDAGLHWAGPIALGPLISYIILMLTKLYNTYFISTTSLKKERAYSAYLTTSKTYNTIDEDHKKPIIITVETSGCEESSDIPPPPENPE